MTGLDKCKDTLHPERPSTGKAASPSPPPLPARSSPPVPRNHPRCERGPGQHGRQSSFTESQNHRMFGVGRDLCGSPSPTPCPSRVTESRLHRTAARRGWNISREGDSTASLGSLFQGSGFSLLEALRRQPAGRAPSRLPAHSRMAGMPAFVLGSWETPLAARPGGHPATTSLFAKLSGWVFTRGEHLPSAQLPGPERGCAVGFRTLFILRGNGDREGFYPSFAIRVRELLLASCEFYQSAFIIRDF